jgi:hypothetical protein
MAADKAREALKYLFADFERRDDHGDLWTKAEMVRIAPKELPVPGLLLFLLTRIMGLRNLGPDEKTAWHVPMRFRGHRVTIASQKFGLRLYIRANSDCRESAEEIGRAVIQRLAKALRIVEREVLANYAAEQIAEGSVTVANQSHRLRAMYQHFRAAAAFAFAESTAPPKPPVPCGDRAAAASLFEGVNEKIRQEQIGAWETLATVNAYFSVLEHELVLVSAFSDLDPMNGGLEQLVGDGWGTKFKKLFDLADKEAKGVHDCLREIAETWRNPYSHGGFEKGKAAVWFHLEGIGAVPGRLSDIRSSPHFELFPVQPEGFQTICDAFDVTDRWLRDGRYAAALTWVASGNDVVFDPDSRATYRRIAQDEDLLREEIEHESMMWERMANFEM